MPGPKLLTWRTVLAWAAGMVGFVILMTEFWGHGYLILTPAIALIGFRFHLIFEPKWDLDAELKAILGRG